MMNYETKRQRGAVSIFIVLFASLLITVITVGFTRIMLHEQSQASATDLSQSAYDSAQAGVEDAKRALVRWQNECQTGGTGCANLETIINQKRCNTVPRMIYNRDAGNMSEVQVQTNSDDEELNQAYTCTVINTQTNNYQGRIEADESQLVQLKGVGGFDSIKLSWFTRDDLASGGSASLSSSITLPNGSSWPGNRPPIMRTQLIKVNDTFSLADLDTNTGSSTLYLYPNLAGSVDTFDFLTDSRRQLKQIERVRCSQTLGSKTHFCEATIKIEGGVAANGEAFLRLAAHYRAAHYEISLYRDGSLVQFNGVQPEVDSTGRANTLFRRVVSRVELSDPTFPYPEAAVDIAGDFCKAFMVTDTEYIDTSGCTP